MTLTLEQIEDMREAYSSIHKHQAPAIRALCDLAKQGLAVRPREFLEEHSVINWPCKDDVLVGSWHVTENTLCYSQKFNSEPLFYIPLSALPVLKGTPHD
jgi:hypothetical protein